MRKKVLYLLVFAGIICFIFTSIQKLEAQEPIFFADFDENGIPNNDVNEPGNWEPENAAIQWDVAPFPANGTQALLQATEGCDASGFTPFPTIDNFTDGVIQADFGWQDDDSVGIMFRRNGEESGYFVFFGYIETTSLAIFDLADGTGLNGSCLDQLGLEVDGKVDPTKAIEVVDHNLPEPLNQDGATSYTGRILVKGPTIMIWYGLTENFPDEPLEYPHNVASMIRIEDSTYTEGSVGIWHESWGNGLVDNIYVYGPEAALAVTPKEKTAITWGSLKSK